MYLISDAHGNIDGLMRAMRKAKIVSKDGMRLTTEPVYSIGDLANCVRDSIDGDLACLHLVQEGIIDGIVIGNHEFPYIAPGKAGFGGFHFDYDVHSVIAELYEQDRIFPSILIEDTLVTHAGISLHIRKTYPDEYMASTFHDMLTEIWDARHFDHSLISNVGQSRGGLAAVGGVLWCDFRDEFYPTDFPQIVGHTPYGVTWKGNSVCIDVGAKDQGTKPFILRVI